MAKEYKTVAATAFATYAKGKVQREVGDTFGIHGTTVSAYLKEGRCPVAIEKLAEFLLMENGHPKQVVFAGSIDEAHFDTLDAFVKNVGGDIVELEV